MDSPMDAVRRASFASKQLRLGPAPLASFEDLPSDELESPDDVTHLPIQSNALDDESSSQDLQFATPDSLTVSSQSTPRIESDFDSHFTLTPGDDGQSSSELKTTSLSSLSKDSVLAAKQKKGSALSLGTYDAPETEYNQRKSSWTDIFRTHNTNSAKSTSSDSKREKKSSKKKSHSDLPKKDGSDSKHREKSKFLSIFKKKSSKSATTSPVLSGEEEIQEDADQNLAVLQNLPEEVVVTKVTNGNISKGKENEFPKEIELSPSQEAQNDLGKVNTESNDRIPDERKINRKLINISEASFEKEYNIFSLQAQEKELDKVSKSENIQAIVNEEEHESSESEPHAEEKDPANEEDEKEDDFEAETLLPHDLIEGEEDSVIEIPSSLSIETPKQVNMPSRQQRLEVTTKPIDRPRSTTPINVAPLEAFIQSVSPTVSSKGEKIKLSLPGEQFLGRLKSPKRSATKSWNEFCEGLHSPRMNKRTDADELDNPFSDSDFPIDVLVPDSKWTAFEVNFEESGSAGFVDNFTAMPTLAEQTFGEQAFETDFSVASCCSCQCHASDGIDLRGGSSNSNSVNKRPCSSCHCLPNALSGGGRSTVQDSGSKSCDVANVFESPMLEQ